MVDKVRFGVTLKLPLLSKEEEAKIVPAIGRLLDGFSARTTELSPTHSIGKEFAKAGKSQLVSSSSAKNLVCLLQRMFRRVEWSTYVVALVLIERYLMNIGLSLIDLGHFSLQ